jgi:hypothetical protein
MKNFKFMNNDQLELVCSQMLDRYFTSLGNKDEIEPWVDIDNFVLNFLHCTVVYESIASRNNCLGFVSDGVTTITILRNGRKRKVLYDRDTIVLDKYLQMPGNEAKRRFVLGHEAGHVITNRIYGNAAAYYNHAFDSEAGFNKQLLIEQFNIYETQADRISACLLMPKVLLLKYMETYLDSHKVIRYEGTGISKYDRSMLLRIANELKVSITALQIRLKELGLILDKPLPYQDPESKEVFPYEPL